MSTKSQLSLALGVAMLIPGFAQGFENEKGKEKDLNAYSFKMKSLTGDEIDLKKYEGKVVLAVNVASRFKNMNVRKMPNTPANVFEYCIRFVMPMTNVNMIVDETLFTSR